MTREKAIKEYVIPALKHTWNDKINKEVLEALEEEPCEDVISRRSIKQKLQEHHDFFVNAYGGFSNLPQNDKSRVDEIINCIAMVVNEPPVTPQEPQTFKWCTGCREYNQEKHCCHRWSKVIRNTVAEMKQESKTGHWILTDVERYRVWHCHCSECDKDPQNYVVGSENWWLIKSKLPKFCPNCGAKMESEE